MAATVAVCCASTGSYAASKVNCRLAPGTGTGFTAFLGGVWTPLPTGSGYMPPAITAVTPTVIIGEVVAFTVAGSSFGAVYCSSAMSVNVHALDMSEASLLYDVGSGQFAEGTATNLPCAVSSWNDANITCSIPFSNTTVPVGVSVSVAGQFTPATPRGFKLSFAPPMVTGVASGQLVPTIGGTAVSVMGTGFGPSHFPLAVLVNSAQVVVESHVNDTALLIQAPAGGGDRSGVRVVTLFGTSDVAYVLRYAEPVITHILTPTGRPCQGGFAVRVEGQVSSGT